MSTAHLPGIAIHNKEEAALDAPPQVLEQGYNPCKLDATVTS